MQNDYDDRTISTYDCVRNNQLHSWMLQKIKSTTPSTAYPHFVPDFFYSVLIHFDIQYENATESCSRLSMIVKRMFALNLQLAEKNKTKWTCAKVINQPTNKYINK